MTAMMNLNTMKITIDIPDEEIRDAVKGNIIREMIYEPKLKEEIIDKTVNATAHEIRRKGMPILANKLLESKDEDI